jgi:hypothetical protein
MLDKLGVIEYESNLKTVTLTERSRELVPYTTVMSGTGLAWYQHYLLLGLVSMVTIMAADLGLPLVSIIDTVMWAGIFALAMVISLVIQNTAGSAPLRRLRNALYGFGSD